MYISHHFRQKSFIKYICSEGIKGSHLTTTFNLTADFLFFCPEAYLYIDLLHYAEQPKPIKSWKNKRTCSMQCSAYRAIVCL